jgi:lysyl-tRNA synthetase class 2
MVMTDSPSIQDVLFFPQMRPEVKEKIDSEDLYIKKGIPKEWVVPIQKLGYTTISKLEEVENPNKFFQEICGYNKKNKLGLKNPSIEEVSKWFK